MLRKLTYLFRVIPGSEIIMMGLLLSAGLLNYLRVFVVFFLRRGLETTGDSFLMLPNEGPARSQQVMFSNCRRLMYVTCMEGTKKRSIKYITRLAQVGPET